MDPLLILLIGMVVVVGSILVLRLHAFLGLVLGALVVASLTPQSSIMWFQREQSELGKVTEVQDDTVLLNLSAGSPVAGMLLYVFPEDGERRERSLDATGTGGDSPLATLRVESFEEVQGEGRTKWKVTTSIVETDGREILPKDVAILPSAWSAAKTYSEKRIAERVTAGFGKTCAGIGILIAMAAIIGKCLLDSGAADRIVRSTLRLVGEPRAPLAFMGSGFLLGVPVFFDTVFYLMIPLGKAMRMRTGRNYLLYVLTITAGATMAHSLVPPTPGPLVVAETLNVDVGALIMAGFAVGIGTCIFGYFYALWANRKWELPLRESLDMTLEELEALSKRDDAQLPPLWLSLLPIMLPVVLISGNTILDQFPDAPDWLVDWMGTLGDKNIALVIAAAVALVMLVVQKDGGRDVIYRAVQSALAGGAVIILITAAGGAFGGVLRETGIGTSIRELSEKYQISGLGVLVLAFLITTLVRTAQGSATVAMITAANILSDAFQSTELGFHPVYLAVAIGCGSKPIAWMNDSGFWVISKMSGMSEGETLKYVTPMTSLMGLVGLILTLIGAMLFPFA